MAPGRSAKAQANTKEQNKEKDQPTGQSKRHRILRPKDTNLVNSDILMLLHNIESLHWKIDTLMSKKGDKAASGIADSLELQNSIKPFKGLLQDTFNVFTEDGKRNKLIIEYNKRAPTVKLVENFVDFLAKHVDDIEGDTTLTEDSPASLVAAFKGAQIGSIIKVYVDLSRAKRDADKEGSASVSHEPEEHTDKENE